MERKERRGALIGGLILVLVGAMAFVGQFVDADLGGLWGTMIVLGLGLIFLFAGIFTREFGWFVPGGILSGIGAGLALIAGPLEGTFSVDDGGVFLLAFAGGWFLITLMGMIFTREFQWWPLIPGAIIGMVGLAIIYGGVLWQVLEWLNYLWPIALVVGGVYILYRAFTRRSDEIEEKPREKQA